MADYKDAGVDIELGDDVSKILYNAAKQTWHNRKGILGDVIVPFDDFSGMRAVDVSKLPEGTMMNVNFDGVGTKVEIAERMKKHDTLAYDLFAMVCDDAIVRGAEPVLVGSILDVNSLGKERPFLDEVKELARGYVDAAGAANVAVVNGEVAELGMRVGGYGPFNYNWGAAVVWFGNRKKMFTGNEINEGDSIVSLREKGFRSNGLSLVRKVLSAKYGQEWHLERHGKKQMGEMVLEPSRIYSKAVVEMFGGWDPFEEGTAKLTGVAHITGGGIPGKLGRALKASGLGAELDDLFRPSELMLHCQDIGDVKDAEAYKTWNMGNGMLITTTEPDAVMATARKHGLEARLAGKVAAKRGIRIANMGFHGKGELVFE